MFKKNEYGLFSVLNQTIDFFPQLFKQWRVFAAYAVLFTISGAAFGQWAHSCIKKSYWCFDLSEIPYGNGLIIIYLLINLVLTSAFIYDFYNAAFKNKIFVFSEVWKINKEKIKSLFFVISVLVGFALPSFIAVKILLQPGNPNWQIEFLYFTIAFSMILFPMMFVRLFGK